MAAISGKLGSVTFAAGYTTNCYKWDCTDSGEILDTTPFNPPGGYKTNTGGLKEFTGSYECWLDDTTPLPVALDTGAATFVAEGARKYTGDIRVQSTATGAATDGSSRAVTVSFTGTGPLTPA